jgi:hypothetical protein
MTVDGADVEGLRSVLEDMLAGRIPMKIEAKTPISYEHLAEEWDQFLRDSVILKPARDGVQQPRAVPAGSV